MLFTATSIQDYRNKLAAIKTLDLEIEKITLSGMWATDSITEAKEYLSNSQYCARVFGSVDDYCDADTSVESWREVSHVGFTWITVESEGSKVLYRFPCVGEQRTDGYGSEKAQINIWVR